jgi:hypothetical protein
MRLGRDFGKRFFQYLLVERQKQQAHSHNKICKNSRFLLYYFRF